MPSFFNSQKNDRQLKKIPIEKISANPYQPRKHFDSDSINSLADSIARHGVIQPITVRKKDSGFEVVAGERRLRAARIAGLEQIPCVIVKVGERKSAELALTENLQRCDLDIFEEAQALERMLSEGSLTQAKLAEDLSMSQSAVANKLRLLRFDEECRAVIRKHRLSERHARCLLRVPPEKRREVAEKIGSCGMSVTRAEEYIDTILCAGMAKNTLVKKSSRIKRASTEPEKQDVTEQKEEQKPIRRFLLGDLTLFFNSLERSLAMLENAGFKGELEKNETEDGKIFLSITLEKNAGKR